MYLKRFTLPIYSGDGMLKRRTIYDGGCFGYVENTKKYFKFFGRHRSLFEK